ncbi:MAG: DUF2764 family protein [Lentisphaeria bacterium]|nr:DUF2764 family protein [Lentisphaeria bacterium]
MSYYALISSLPMLLLEGNAGFTPERFLSYCDAYVSGDKLKILEDLGLDPSLERFKPNSLPGRYAIWECALRNAIVRKRSHKLNVDAAKYLNEDAWTEADVERIVAAAWMVSSPLEREKILDQARWEKIEELEAGQLFSFEQLCAYKLKLLLQLKWVGRSPEQAAQNLDLATSMVERSIELQTKQEN